MPVICLEWWDLVVAASSNGITIAVQIPVMSLIMEVAKAMQIASMTASSVKSFVKLSQAALLQPLSQTHLFLQHMHHLAWISAAHLWTEDHVKRNMLHGIMTVMLVHARHLYMVVVVEMPTDLNQKNNVKGTVEALKAKVGIVVSV